MTDEEKLAQARGVVITILRLKNYLPEYSFMLEPDLYYEDMAESVCIAQQIIAEATGLVGMGDT